MATTICKSGYIHQDNRGVQTTLTHTIWSIQDQGGQAIRAYIEGRWMVLEFNSDTGRWEMFCEVR